MAFFGSNNRAAFQDNSGSSYIDRVAGVLKASDDGVTSYSLGGGFGSDTIVQVANAALALVNSLEMATTLPTKTADAEFGQLTFRLVANGALTDVANLTFAGNATTPRFLLGDVASAYGILRVGSTNLQLTRGTAVLDFSNQGATWFVRANEASGAGTVATNTLTLISNANLTVVPGTPTINGIVTAGYATGFSGRLRVASGTTIVNNSGAPGTGAVAILTPTGANIVTSSARVLPISYDGTNWFVDG